MRIAIVHHWFVSQGGGERVAEVFGGMFPQADIFTLFADPDHVPAGLRNRQLTSSFLDRIPGAKRVHRHLLPLYPLAVEQLDLTGYDLVLSSDSGPMKGVITDQNAVHVCYCHSPMRYLWDNYHSYSATMPTIAKVPFALSAHYVRSWDYSAAQRVTHFIANSNYVAGRIQHYYQRDSTIIYPPIDTQRGYIASRPQDYYLAAGRLVPYKRTELLIGACNLLERRLRVVGVGPELDRLRSIAGPTIEFVGRRTTDELWQDYAHCRALLFAADEDFGMVPLEAQACGRPVIAFGKGGSLETVCAKPGNAQTAMGADEKETGVFFLTQSDTALAEAILRFEQQEFNFSPTAIQNHARRFDTSVFIERMRQFFFSLAPEALSIQEQKLPPNSSGRLV